MVYAEYGPIVEKPRTVKQAEECPRDRSPHPVSVRPANDPLTSALMRSTMPRFLSLGDGILLSAAPVLCCLVAIVTACSGGADVPEGPTEGGPVAIAPDTQFVYLNELGRFTGTGVGPAERCQWSTGDAGIAAVDGGGVITPRAAGTTMVRLACGSRAATAVLVIGGADNRPVRRLALGDSARDTVDLGGSRSRFEVQLTKGDTVDLITDAGFNATALVVRAPLLPTGPPVSAYQQYLGIVVPETRAYLIHVDRTLFTCTGYHCNMGFTVPYRLLVRRSGPVLNAIVRGNFGSRLVRQGEMTRDTLWVQNVGTGAFDVLASIDSAPWASVAPRFSISGPTRLDTIAGGTHAAGVVPVVLTIDARSLASGGYQGRLTLDAPGAFDIAGRGAAPRIGRAIHAIVYDPLVQYLAAPTIPSSMIASTPSGALFTITSTAVARFDSLTGAVSAPVAIRNYSSPLRLGPDGAAYGAYGTSILRVGRAGDSTVISTGGAFANHLVVLPDSSLYFFGLDLRLYRIGADGARSDVLTLSAVGRTGGNMVFNPTNNSLYFMEGSRMHRVDLSRRTEEVVALSLPACNPAVGYCAGPAGTLELYAVDASGRLYGAGNPGVVVLSPAGAIVEQFIPGRPADGLAVVGNTLFGSTNVAPYGDPSNIWRRPIR